MYLNSKSYKKKYLKYKNKYFTLKKQLGGDCNPLPEPEDQDPITLDNLMNLGQDERITIKGKCYDVRGLYGWIIRQNKKSVPDTRMPITDFEKQQIIDAYLRIESPEERIIREAADIIQENDDNIPSEVFDNYYEDEDNDWVVPDVVHSPVFNQREYRANTNKFTLLGYCDFFYINIASEDLTIIKNENLEIHNLSITENCLDNLTSLKTIDLNFNNYVRVTFDYDVSSQNAITNDTLETFKLKTNSMQAIPPRMFVNLNLLTSIDLSYNKIREIYRESFINLPVLQVLNLSNNEISEIPRDLFQNLQTLKNIDLNNNEISILPNKLFKNLSNLEVITLINNQLTIIPDKLFKNLPKLRALHLSHNQISTISMNTFMNLPVIYIIGLSGNKINKIERNSFVNLNSKVMVVLQNSILNESNKQNIGYEYM
jgi:Leucine-rich repeat (LRR) protein